MQTIRIKKGVNFYLNERDKFNTAIFQVDFVFPTDAQYFADLNLLSDLLKKHSTKFKLHQQITDFLENHYGANLDLDYDFFGKTANFSFTLSFVHPRLLKDSQYCFANLINFLAEIIFNQNDRMVQLFENEKNYCKNVLKENLTDPETLIFYQALPQYISSSQLNVPLSGTFTQLNAVKIDHVYDLWQHLLQTSAVNIYYDGFSLSSEDQRVIHQFSERFFPRRSWDFDYPYYLEAKPARTLIQERRNNLNESILLQQYYLNGHAKYRGEHYAAWLIFNQIFGGDSESFLFQEIREKRQLSYEVYSSLSFGLNCFYVYATLNDNQFELVDQEINQIFHIISQVAYDPLILDNAKKSIENLLLYQNDGRLFEIAQQKMKFIIPNYISNTELIQEIQAVTSEDLVACSEKIQPGIKMWYRGI